PEWAGIRRRAFNRQGRGRSRAGRSPAPPLGAVSDVRGGLRRGPRRSGRGRHRAFSAGRRRREAGTQAQGRVRSVGRAAVRAPVVTGPAAPPVRPTRRVIALMIEDFWVMLTAALVAASCGFVGS